MRNQPTLLCLIVLLCSLASGCMQRIAQHPLPACAALLTDLSRQVAKHTHSEPDTHPVPGFPLLRTNRFLASYRYTELNPAQRSAWLAQAFDLAQQAWQVEFARLPPAVQQQLRTQHSLDDLAQQLAHCHRQQPPPTALSPEQITPADNYRTLLRILGLYPLTAWLAEPRIEDYRQTMTAHYQARQQQAFATALRYHPPGLAYATSDTSPVAFALDALGIPVLSDAERQHLFHLYAPVLEVEQHSAADLIGALELTAPGAPQVQTQRPTAYTYTDLTRWQDQVVLRLHYVFWFPSRPAQSRWDVYAGELDSLVWRVTLNNAGQPILYDSIHSCGCYHLIFVPADRRLTLAGLQGEQPIVFTLPETVVPPLQLRLEAATHYLVGVSHATPHSQPARPYQFRDYRDLLTLPHADSHHSLFAANGLIPASERLERFLFWPLGIPSAGAMRQRGTQATAFIGRRHFDAADLLDQLGLE